MKPLWRGFATREPFSVQMQDDEQSSVFGCFQAYIYWLIINLFDNKYMNDISTDGSNSVEMWKGCACNKMSTIRTFQDHDKKAAAPTLAVVGNKLVDETEIIIECNPSCTSLDRVFGLNFDVNITQISFSYVIRTI